MSSEFAAADLYPESPAAVPPNLTDASPAYKQRAWLALLGLGSFVLLYFALSGWLTWTAYRLLKGSFDGSGFFPAGLVGIGAAFLAVFMWKALFFVKHAYDIEDLEITRAEQPKLFAFIDRLADEAQAPRAHRVFLSPRVNAAVFYDLSLLNLIVPSKKNLEIGLGLVNVLTLGELKAVLAHEFGHFAQRSMAVGRWVYIAQQIAGQIIAKRDVLDRIVQQISRFDVRIAWVGWVLSLLLWSIRSLMEIVFRGVVIAQRALSRQMEFQADLVSVSLTGSDALISALHRLGAADDAWGRTLAFAQSEANAGRGVSDLFSVQERVLGRVREILGQPDYGVSPLLPQEGRENHRVFKTALAQPPHMWATHPPNNEREANAKQRYVEAHLDERSAWQLFAGASDLRLKMSEHVLRSAKVEIVPLEVTLSALDEQYGAASLDRAYRGAYLGRSITRGAASARDLFGAPPTDLRAELAALYPESFGEQLELLSEQHEEKAALEALRDQVAIAPGGIIRHRGRELQRTALPAVIEELSREIEQLERAVQAHDARCRAAHLAAAESIGGGWPEALRGHVELLHYAEHSEANLRDVSGVLANVFAVVVADGRVSKSERARLLAASHELHGVLAHIHAQAPEVELTPRILGGLSAESWPLGLGKFELPAPNEEQLGDWLNVIDSWKNAALSALAGLRSTVLNELLVTERSLSSAILAGETLPSAVSPPHAPPDYPTLVAGKERPRQARLSWWDRFQIADGAVPTVARLAAACAIIGVGIGFAGAVGESTLTILNGLAREVIVHAGNQKVTLAANEHRSISVPEEAQLHVRATTGDGREIETFDQRLHGKSMHYVYNVAGAAPLVLWTMVYGELPVPPVEQLGAPRWYTSGADYVFEEPPESVRSNGATTRSVLASITSDPPWLQAQTLADDASRAQLALEHARWDALDSPHILDWMAIARGSSEFAELLADRFEEAPTSPVLLRIEQDTAGEARGAVCARHEQAAKRASEDGDLLYAAIRCMESGPAQEARIAAARVAHPRNGWITLASGLTAAEHGEFAVAEAELEEARSSLPQMAEHLADVQARLRRLRGASIDDLLSASAQLRVLAAGESGNAAAGTPLEALSWLAQGEVARAAEHARALGKDGHGLFLLAAASDGATPDLAADAALVVPQPNDSPTVLLAALALAERNGRDSRSIEAALAESFGEGWRSAAAFLADVRVGDRSPSLADRHRLNPHVRGVLLSSAVISLGADAPPEWRAQAKALAFVGERPFLR